MADFGRPLLIAFIPANKHKSHFRSVRRIQGTLLRNAAKTRSTVAGLANVDGLPMQSVALVVVSEWTDGLVDGDFVEVGSSEAQELSVEVGKEAALKERVVGEIDTRNNVRYTECHLLRLGEEIVRVAVEDHPAYALNWY